MSKVFFKTRKDHVACLACKKYCNIVENAYGYCGARKNINGKLVPLTYSKPSSIAVDPIEKKPLYHFYPGTKTLSLGFYGCNFSCAFCQNYSLSCTKGEVLENALKGLNTTTHEQLAKIYSESASSSVSFTYNEPGINPEYNIDLMDEFISKKVCDKFVYVTNGYESEEQLLELEGKVSAVNIDLKSFSQKFYDETCIADLEKVLATIKSFHKKKIWVEISTLIIPGKNNSDKELSEIASFIASIDKNIPWHLLSFFPMHKMLSTPLTTLRELAQAKQMGKNSGLNYVYVGNTPHNKNTFCPNCGMVVIKRYPTIKKEMRKNKCPNCGKKIKGIFEK